MPGAPSERTTIRRVPQRGHYEREVIHAILDAGLVAHVGFVADGTPLVIPMVYARMGEALVLHGARASRLQKTLAGGIPVCVTVTLVDGIVLARSAFHHSMNYRSVVIMGEARALTDEAEKRLAFRALIDHVVPGRNERIRPSDDAELRGTTVLAIPLAEASAKIRRGPPVEEARDLPYPAWAGVIPLRVHAEPLVPVEGLDPIAQAATEAEHAFARPS